MLRLSLSRQIQLLQEFCEPRVIAQAVQRRLHLDVQQTASVLRVCPVQRLDGLVLLAGERMDFGKQVQRKLHPSFVVQFQDFLVIGPRSSAPVSLADLFEDGQIPGRRASSYRKTLLDIDCLFESSFLLKGFCKPEARESKAVEAPGFGRRAKKPMTEPTSSRMAPSR